MLAGADAGGGQPLLPLAESGNVLCERNSKEVDHRGGGGDRHALPGGAVARPAPGRRATALQRHARARARALGRVPGRAPARAHRGGPSRGAGAAGVAAEGASHRAGLQPGRPLRGLGRPAAALLVGAARVRSRGGRGAVDRRRHLGSAHTRSNPRAGGHVRDPADLLRRVGGGGAGRSGRAGASVLGAGPAGGSGPERRLAMGSGGDRRSPAVAGRGDGVGRRRGDHRQRRGRRPPAVAAEVAGPAGPCGGGVVRSVGFDDRPVRRRRDRGRRPRNDRRDGRGGQPRAGGHAARLDGHACGAGRSGGRNRRRARRRVGGGQRLPDLRERYVHATVGAAAGPAMGARPRRRSGDGYRRSGRGQQLLGLPLGRVRGGV